MDEDEFLAFLEELEAYDEENEDEEFDWDWDDEGGDLFDE